MTIELVAGWLVTIELVAPVAGWLVDRKQWVEVFTDPEGVEYVRGTPGRYDVVISFARLGLQPLYLRRLNDVSKKRLHSLCQRHRLYQAKRKPRTNCEQCWDAYRGKTDSVQPTMGEQEQGTGETVSTAIPPTE